MGYAIICNKENQVVLKTEDNVQITLVFSKQNQQEVEEAVLNNLVQVYEKRIED